jgi:ribosome-interacting GTPase 1
MEEIWHRCNMIRIYTKPQGQIPDYEEPVILHSTNPTIEEFCNRLHRGIMSEFNYGELLRVSLNVSFRNRPSHQLVCMLLFNSLGVGKICKAPTPTLWKGAHVV